MTSAELQLLPVGERVVYVRKKILGVTQAGFARQVGVSERTVKRWETSFIAPSRTNAEKIAELANVAAELFYPDDAEPETDRATEAVGEVKDLLADWTAQASALLQQMKETLETQTQFLEQMAANQAASAERLADQADLLRAVSAEVAALREERAKRRPAQRRKT